MPLPRMTDASLQSRAGARSSVIWCISLELSRQARCKPRRHSAAECAATKVRSAHFAYSVNRENREQRTRHCTEAEAARAGRWIGRAAAVPIAGWCDPEPDQLCSHIEGNADNVAIGTRADTPPGHRIDDDTAALVHHDFRCPRRIESR